MYAGQILISKKEEIPEKSYLLHANGDKEVSFRLSPNETILISNGPGSSEKVEINKVWGDIKEGSSYYMVYEVLRFPFNMFQKTKILQFHFY